MQALQVLATKKLLNLFKAAPDHNEIEGDDNTEWRLTTFVFLAALSVRTFFAVTHPHFNNIFSVRGVPYSDGLTWTRAAFSLAQGNGLGDVYRPLYSVFLALFYTWHIPLYALVTIANSFFSAITAVFIYQIAYRCLNQPFAFATTAFFILDPAQSVQIPQATTEPMGLMLSVASVNYLLDTKKPENLRPTFLSGALLALSNLARPLTLICTPFYVIYLFVQELLEKRGWRRAFLVIAVFILALSGCLAPWLIRQRLVNGVWAISTNLGEAFYAATSPKYRSWTPNVRLDADRAGVPGDQGHRYKFFMEQGKQQILKHPGFYFGQCSRAFWTSLTSFDHNFRRTSRFFDYRQWTRQVETLELLLTIMATFLVAAGLKIWKRNGALPGIVFLVVSSGLLILWWNTPPFAGAFILLVGMVGSCWIGSPRAVILLGGSLLFSQLTNAMFNNRILYRSALMTDWLFGLFYLAAFYVLAVAGVSIVLHLVGRSRPDFLRSVWWPVRRSWRWNAFCRRVSQVAGGVIASFFVISACRLLYLNFVPNAAETPTSVTLDADQVSEVLRRANAEQTTTEEKPSLEITRLTHEIYFFPRGTNFAKRDSLFKSRPFAYSIFRTARYTVLFPGEVPHRLHGSQVVLVGRLEGSSSFAQRPKELMQCTTIIPVSNTNGLDYEHAVTVPPMHKDVL